MVDAMATGYRISPADMEAARLVFVMLKDVRPMRKVAIPIMAGMSWATFIGQVLLSICGSAGIFFLRLLSPLTAPILVGQDQATDPGHRIDDSGLGARLLGSRWYRWRSIAGPPSFGTPAACQAHI
jgi:hypothetical protein